MSIGIQLHIAPKKAQHKADDRVLVKIGDILNIIFADVQALGVQANNLIEDILGGRENVLFDAFSGRALKM